MMREEGHGIQKTSHVVRIVVTAAGYKAYLWCAYADTVRICSEPCLTKTGLGLKQNIDIKAKEFLRIPRSDAFSKP